MTDTTAPDAATLHLTSVLHRLAGADATPRGDQLDAVRAIIQPAARVLVVQATGWGKSAVYWAATSALRAAGAGPTLVISPLLALMRDQVAAAERSGLRAATVNSTNLDEWGPVFQALDHDQLDVLLVSPERLGNPRFAARLDDLMGRVGLVVIDEAHCISDWGFDFRPDYQRLARALLNTPSASVLATTATANQRVTTDVERQLGSSTVTFRGTLARTSLRLSVVPELSAVQRYAWVADALGSLPGSGIIYVLTVAEAERLAAFLQHCGWSTPAYTGQLEADERVRIEGLLRRNEVKAVVATSALGMGYDKPDLGFCLHVGSPSTPVAYYQQVGRAGRAVAHAEAVLLPAANDEQIWQYFATASIPDPESADKVLQTLSAGPLGLLDVESATGLRRGRLEALLKILAVDGVVAKDGTRWEATGQPYVHDHEKWTELARSRRAEADLMRHYAHGEGCLMAYLQTALDDPGWSAEVAVLTRSGWGDIPAELLDGAVATLGRWRSTWPARPIAVVPAPAPGAEMRANRLLAQHLAAVGKLPLVECFAFTGGPAPSDSSSGPVVAHLETAVALDPSATVPRGPVLLCATSMRSGWTLTIAAALLHETFGCSSMPLVLHRRP